MTETNTTEPDESPEDMELDESEDLEEAAEADESGSAGIKALSMQVYYLVKVELLGIKPVIWRQFFVRANITLNALHDILQRAMGWSNVHYHSFEAGGVEYGDPSEWKGDDVLVEFEHTLGEAAPNKGDKLVYIYNISANWRHEVTVVDDQYDPAKVERHGHALEGSGECPPESCRGVAGYDKYCRGLLETYDPYWKKI
ncbi:MAG: plasmid pRiA4b ORF-3 family protein [Deltaproteobacteria bacterium]|jgi:hypothetical protein|nr:plasmid pRiA4b ORF-3 family protein [Deltaproteobacteria bacterium]